MKLKLLGWMVVIWFAYMAAFAACLSVVADSSPSSESRPALLDHVLWFLMGVLCFPLVYVHIPRVTMLGTIAGNAVLWSVCIVSLFALVARVRARRAR